MTFVYIHSYSDTIKVNHAEQAFDLSTKCFSELDTELGSVIIHGTGDVAVEVRPCGQPVTVYDGTETVTVEPAVMQNFTLDNGKLIVAKINAAEEGAPAEPAPAPTEPAPAPAPAPEGQGAAGEATQPPAAGGTGEPTP